MTTAPQYVTLVVQGGTPVRISDQRGAPYPTTGRGALVFADNPILNNPTFTGRAIWLNGQAIGLDPGTVTAPAIYFGDILNDDGFYSEGPGHVNVTINGIEVADFSSTGLEITGDITYSDTLTGNNAHFTGAVTAPTVPYPDNDTTVATTAYVAAAIATEITGAYLPLTGGTVSGDLWVGSVIHMEPDDASITAAKINITALSVPTLNYSNTSNPANQKKWATRVRDGDGFFELGAVNDAGVPFYSSAWDRFGGLTMQSDLHVHYNWPNPGAGSHVWQDGSFTSYSRANLARGFHFRIIDNPVDAKSWLVQPRNSTPGSGSFAIEALTDAAAVTVQKGWYFHRDGSTVFPGSLTGTVINGTIANISNYATIGGYTARIIGQAQGQGTYGSLQIVNSPTTSTTLSMYRYTASQAGPVIVMGTSRNTTIGAPGVLNVGDTMGIISFDGSDGVQFTESASMRARVDATVTPGTAETYGLIPSRLEFMVTPVGGFGPTEAMRISSNRIVSFITYPIAPTPPVGDSTLKLATTEFVTSGLGGLGGFLPLSGGTLTGPLGIGRAPTAIFDVAANVASSSKVIFANIDTGGGSQIIQQDAGPVRVTRELGWSLFGTLLESGVGVTLRSSNFDSHVFANTAGNKNLFAINSNRQTVYYGATSGTAQIQAAAVSGSVVITWPAATGTVALVSQLAGYVPITGGPIGPVIINNPTEGRVEIAQTGGHLSLYDNDDPMVNWIITGAPVDRKNWSLRGWSTDQSLRLQANPESAGNPLALWTFSRSGILTLPGALNALNGYTLSFVTEGYIQAADYTAQGTNPLFAFYKTDGAVDQKRSSWRTENGDTVLFHHNDLFNIQSKYVFGRLGTVTFPGEAGPGVVIGPGYDTGYVQASWLNLTGWAGMDLVSTYSAVDQKASQIYIADTDQGALVIRHRSDGDAVQATWSFYRNGTTQFPGVALGVTPPVGALGTELVTAAWVLEHAGGGSGTGAIFFVGPAPPPAPVIDQLWWNSDAVTGGGQLYVYYNDGNSVQWIPAAPAVGGGGSSSNTITGDFFVNGSTTLRGVVDIVASSGFGELQVTGPSGAYIDLVSPSTEDFDLRLVTYGAGGSLLSNAAINLQTLTVDPINFWINSVNKFSVNDTYSQFYHALVGTDATFTSFVSAGTPSSGGGRAFIQGGDATHPGYLALMAPGEVRLGYIGFNPGKVSYNADLGYIHEFSTGNVSMLGNLTISGSITADGGMVLRGAFPTIQFQTLGDSTNKYIRHNATKLEILNNAGTVMFSLADNMAATFSGALTGTTAAFSGEITAATPATADNDTTVATTAFVKAQGYVTAASPALSGNPTAPTPAIGDNDTSIATTAYVQAEIATLAQTSQTGTYSTVLSDAGGSVYHPAAAAAANWTIPANATVAYQIGSTITFINDSTNAVTIICGDTMVWSPAGTTGNRTLAQYGVATAVKVTATRWVLSGTGLT